jgi:SAM-dependent methyltransferase
MKTALRNSGPAIGTGYRAQDAWTAFWADAAQSHCVAGAPAIQRSLAAHWTALAGSMRADTCVLDLGCGAGVVGSWMLGARPELRVTGVDLARLNHQLHPQLELVSGTPMEDLPFDDGLFGAVVSQFGFEYARRDLAAREIARVLRPGGALSLLVHHAGSPVLSNNRNRLAVLELLLSARMQTAFCEADAPALGALLSALRERYPDDDLLCQLSRALPPRLRLPAPDRVATWNAIGRALAPERCLLQALRASCVSEVRLNEWLHPLHAVCESMAVSVLRESNGDPIAWKVEGCRRAHRD